jgi:hypothetical protein
MVAGHAGTACRARAANTNDLENQAIAKEGL